MTGSGGEHDFVDYGASLLRILFKIVVESLCDGLRHYTLYVAVAEFSLEIGRAHV